jgi:hypothetical protein
MKRNILIIGLGKMGFSHLTSLLNDKYHYRIDIYDKNKNLKTPLISKKKLCILKNLPKQKKYSLVIIATGPEVRFKLASHVLKNNEVQILLLEKFLFKNLNEFKKFEKIIKKIKTKIFVNLWAKIIFEKLKLKTFCNKKIDIFVILRNNSLLTNIVHFFYLIKLIDTKNKIFINLRDSNFLKKKNKSEYDELIGKIEISSNKSRCLICSTKRDSFSINLSTTKKKRSYKLKNGHLFYNGEDKKKYKIQFPLAKNFTSKFYNDYYFKKKTHLPYYEDVNSLSKYILFEVEKYFKKKILIR